MREDEKIDHEVNNLELILVYDGELNYAEVLVVLPRLQVQVHFHQHLPQNQQPAQVDVLEYSRHKV